MKFRNIVLAGSAAFAGSAQASQYMLHNWCSYPIWVWWSNPAFPTWETPQLKGCDIGIDGYCYESGFQINPGENPIWPMDWLPDGTSVKISRDTNNDLLQLGLLQFEYTHNIGGLWYDMSNLDGGGPGISASRFGDGNVKLTVVGDGADQPDPAQFPTCRSFHCPAYQTCIDMYNTPTDNWAVHYCPSDLWTVFIDLCEPLDHFWGQRDLHTASDMNIWRERVKSALSVHPSPFNHTLLPSMMELDDYHGKRLPGPVKV